MMKSNVHRNYSPTFTVLFLIDQIFAGQGGSEQHLNWLLERLPNKIVKKKFIVFSRIFGNADLFPLQPAILGDEYGRGKKNFIRRFLALSQYIKEEQIDIVHAFSPMIELISILACWSAGCGAVCGHRRNIGYGLNLKTHVMSRVVKLFKIPYIANSDAAKQAAYKNEQIILNRITVIRNPVLLDKAQRGVEREISRNDIPVPLDSPLIGMVASVRTIKGYEVFVQAAMFVLNKWRDAYFICIGEQDPIYLKKLKVLASDLQIEDRIIWYGSVVNAFQILHHLTVAVLSSHSESFSNAVLEYAVAERAIVATDVGGMREIVIDGETGFLVPPNCPETLAKRIITFLEDPDKRKTFGINAKRNVMRQYSEEKITQQYLHFYKNIVLQK